jgi:tRNA(adenine34) deaminase
MNELDTKYMKEAIKQAKKAEKLKEVPIGCVIVYQDKIIARGYNRRNTDKTTLGHAEITAIKKASRVIGDWKTAQYILHLNPARCVPGRLYRHGFQGLLSAR